MSKDCYPEQCTTCSSFVNFGSCYLCSQCKTFKDIMCKAILETTPWDELVLGAGITEIELFGEEKKSIGISYEDLRDEGGPEQGYVYNMFHEDTYFNISTRGSKENPLPDTVLADVIELWCMF